MLVVTRNKWSFALNSQQNIRLASSTWHMQTAAWWPSIPVYALLIPIRWLLGTLKNLVQFDLAGWDSYILLPATSSYIIIARMMKMSSTKIMPNPSLAKVAGGAHGTNNWFVIQQCTACIQQHAPTARLTLRYVQLGHKLCTNCNTALEFSSVPTSLVWSWDMHLDHRKCHDITWQFCHALTLSLVEVCCGIMAHCLWPNGM